MQVSGGLQVKPRILVVEDDPKVLSALTRGLALEGYEVDSAADGPGALALAGAHPPDVAVLDVMLPGMSGLEVCDRLRRPPRPAPFPILFLTARDSVQDRVAGLDRGADDYLVKPFAFDELVARLRALLRRAKPAEPDELLHYGDLELSPATREVWRAGETLSLTAREFDLLEFFLRHPRRVLTRARILEQVWGYDYLGGSNVIDVYVRVLREKLETGERPRLIQTVRGVGYALREGDR
ncbi:MAG TPA: response regulator transcription factor [Chloroflexota bacterium]|nr:response regulator transcription factor [Chloroflexota bacterium]